MLSKIASSLSHTIWHAQKTHMSSKLTSSLLLYSARSEERICQLSLTSSLALYLARSEKRICQVRLPKNLYSIQHAHKIHMSSKIDFKSHTLFGTLRKCIGL